MKYSKNIFHLHCVHQIIIFLLISLTSTLRVKPRLAKLNPDSNGYPAESQSNTGNNQTLFEALPLQFLTEFDRQSAEADLSYKLPVPNKKREVQDEEQEIVQQNIENSTIKYSNESQIDSGLEQVIESREGPTGQNHLPFALPFIGDLSHNNGPEYDYIPQKYIGHLNQNHHFDHQVQYDNSYEKSSISPRPDATEEIHLTSDLDDVQNIHLHLYLDGPESGEIQTSHLNSNLNSNQNSYNTEPSQISEKIHYQVNRIDYAGNGISPTAGSIENPDRGYKYRKRPSASYGNQGSAGSHFSFKIPTDLLCLKGLSAGFATFKTIFLAVKGAIGFKGFLLLLTPVFIVLAPILLLPLLLLLLFLPIPVLTPTAPTTGTTTQRYDNGGGGYGSGGGNNGGGYGGGGNGGFNMSYGGGGGYGSTTRRTTTTSTTPSTPTLETTMSPITIPTVQTLPPTGFSSATATVPNFPMQNNNMMMMITPAPSLLPGITGIGQQFNPGGSQLFPGTGGQLPGGQMLPNLQQPGMQPGLPGLPTGPQTLPIGITGPQQQMMMMMPMTMTRPSPGGTSVMPTTPTRTTTSDDDDTRIQSHKHHFYNLNKNNYNLNQFPLLQATELSKIILQSEDCLERIMCELESSNNFRKDYGYMVDKEQEAAEERVDKWIKMTLRDAVKYDQMKNKFGGSFAERRDCNDFFCRRISYIKRVFNWF